MNKSMTWRTWTIACGLVAATALPAAAQGVPNPIKHVIIIVQENRSFDSYFGTYPGASGIPAGTCLWRDLADHGKGCVAPFHDVHDINAGGPHGYLATPADIDQTGGVALMDGYVATQLSAGPQACKHFPPAVCAAFEAGIARADTMGYHTAAEIPNYWAYANRFVLMDHLYEGVRSWSLASHIDIVSEWVADCKKGSTDVKSCKTSLHPILKRRGGDYLWASLPELLDKYNVSWRWYLATGTEPDCNDDEMTCEPIPQQGGVASVWNPAPDFAGVKAQGRPYVLAHNPPIEQFLADAAQGTLPQVSWVVPTDYYSEHPPGGVTAGMEYVTGLVNAVMQGPLWSSSAIFICWDDWGGFYDHVNPPEVDHNNSAYPIQGFGLRVPGLLISPYAKGNYIDHSVLTFASYARFFEDLFMNGARLDPAQLGKLDSRPTIRDALTHVTLPDGTVAPMGDLMQDFTFTRPPQPPLILPTHIPVGITATCSTPPTAACTSRTVSVAWSAPTNPNITQAFTYHIRRDGVELPQCVGVATTCIDTPPSSGPHFYRAYAIDSAGAQSPESAAAEADTP